MSSPVSPAQVDLVKLGTRTISTEFRTCTTAAHPSQLVVQVPNPASRSSIQRILHDNSFRSYHIKVVQQLIPEDKDRRVEFAEWPLARISDDDSFLENLMFSDEAIFHLNGKVNKATCRIWSKDNPQWITEAPLQSDKVVAWVALSSNSVIGPYFFPNKTVTGASYLSMLKDFFVPLIVDRPNFDDMIFMQDGANPAFCPTGEGLAGRDIP